MVQNVAPLIRDLEAEDFYLLSGLEHGMRFSEWVNREKLPKLANLTDEEVSYRLDRCHDRELIERRTMQYEGFQLRFEGYDVLALHTFAERDTVEEVGAPLGVGKESDVLEVRGEDVYALKFHREGMTNFREVHREREYTADHDHVSWLYTARKAAEREYEVLQALHESVAVPEPIDQNRHAIVMERLVGNELAETKLDSENAPSFLDQILTEVARAYERGYVHADLSEYNVFVTPSGIRIFDWPQAVPVEHPNAVEFLDRDVENIISYFHRKYPSAINDSYDKDRIAGLIRKNSTDELFNFST